MYFHQPSKFHHNSLKDVGPPESFEHVPEQLPENVPEKAEAECKSKASPNGKAAGKSKASPKGKAAGKSKASPKGKAACKSKASPKGKAARKSKASRGKAACKSKASPKGKASPEAPKGKASPKRKAATEKVKKMAKGSGKNDVQKKMHSVIKLDLVNFSNLKWGCSVIVFGGSHWDQNQPRFIPLRIMLPKLPVCHQMRQGKLPQMLAMSLPACSAI